jgi:hypothetical protein
VEFGCEIGVFVVFGNEVGDGGCGPLTWWKWGFASGEKENVRNDKRTLENER